MWPTTWSNLLGVVVVIGAMIYATDNYKLSSLQPFATVLWKLTYLIYLDEAYPYNFRLAFISTLAGIVFFIVLLYLRQYTLRMLLAYRGWMCKLKPSFAVFSVNLLLTLKRLNVASPQTKLNLWLSMSAKQPQNPILVVGSHLFTWI